MTGFLGGLGQSATSEPSKESSTASSSKAKDSWTYNHVHGLGDDLEKAVVRDPIWSGFKGAVTGRVDAVMNPPKMPQFEELRR